VFVVQGMRSPVSASGASRGRPADQQAYYHDSSSFHEPGPGPLLQWIHHPSQGARRSTLSSTLGVWVDSASDIDWFRRHGVRIGGQGLSVWRARSIAFDGLDGDPAERKNAPPRGAPFRGGTIVQLQYVCERLTAIQRRFAAERPSRGPRALMQPAEVRL